jgi:hypothetical protein
MQNLINAITEYTDQLPQKQIDRWKIRKATKSFIDRGGRIDKQDVSSMPVNLAGDSSEAIDFLRI